MTKAFSAAAEQNREPILAVLREELNDGDTVLELGSGSGQHASFFAEQLPGIIWQPSDVSTCLESIDTWTEAQRHTVRPALALDVRDQSWPSSTFDVCYSANTFHIMALDAVLDLLRGTAAVLKSGGKLCVYGPFSIDGQHTSDSNRQFDAMLRMGDPAAGVRDLTELDREAMDLGFLTARQITMPANNLLVIWQLSSSQ